MKHLWQMLAVGTAVMGAGCADSTTRPTPTTSSVPATIVVPGIRGSEAGRFEFNADGTRLYVEDGPGDGYGECFDVCDDSGGGYDGGDSEVSSGSEEYHDPEFQGSRYTEALFDGSILKGHAEMTYLWADHASQKMTLSTWRPEGSILGSQEFITARIYPLPVLIGQTMKTDGSMPAPSCGARGQGKTIHDLSSSAGRCATDRPKTMRWSSASSTASMCRPAGT